MSKKLDIKEAISLTNYKKDIKQNLVCLLTNNYSEPKNKLYLFSRGKGLPNIFLLKIKIPTKFKNNIYDISLLIYFPLNFPLVQPDIFFQKYSSVKINPKSLNYINEETLRINYDTFFKWENNFESFKKLINELSKQFSNNFPIFTLNDKNEEAKNNNLGCILRTDLCKEIELKKTDETNQNNINKIIIKKDGNSLVNNNRINILYSPREKKNKKDFISMFNKNEKDNSLKIDIDNSTNEKMYYSHQKIINTEKKIHNKNNIFNKPESNSDFFDEEISKECLTKLLLLELFPKITKINNLIKSSKEDINKIKTNIMTELNFFKSKEKQTKTVEKYIYLLKKEIKIFNKDDKTNFKNKMNFSDLDSIIEIKNKNIYELKAKEKALEEYILILKKYFEKKNIEFKLAIKLVRNLSRQIFIIKYRYLSLTGENI